MVLFRFGMFWVLFIKDYSFQFVRSCVTDVTDQKIFKLKIYHKIMKNTDFIVRRFNKKIIIFIFSVREIILIWRLFEETMFDSSKNIVVQSYEKTDERLCKEK